MTNVSLQVEVDNLIHQYDKLNEPFSENQVWDSLARLRKGIEGIVNIPMPLKADMLAFELKTVSLSGNECQYEGLENSIDTDVLEHWKDRAETLHNPLMKNAYADVLWHYSKIASKKPYPEMARLAIDTSFEILKSKKYNHSLDARWYSQRALDLSLKISDEKRIQKAVEIIIQTEDEITIDDKPGLWGFAFEYLLKNKKIKLSETQRNKLVQDMELRLQRFVEAESFHIEGAKKAAEALVSYYKKQNRLKEAQRVIRYLGKAIIEFSQAQGSANVGQTHIYNLFVLHWQNGLKQEARMLESQLYSLGEQSLGEMQTISVSYDIDVNELEEYANQFVQGGLEDALRLTALKFLIPSKEDFENQIKEMAQGSLFSLIFSRKYIDHSGRIIGHSKGIDEQIDPHIMELAMLHIQGSAHRLRAVIKKIFTAYSVDAEKLLEYIYGSSVFQKNRKEFFKDAINSYLNQNYCVMAHMLIPQIEEAIRHLARRNQVSTLKWDANNNGIDFRTLGEILTDPDFKAIWGESGERVVFYLRFILTQEYGWNLRNELCHGLLLPQHLDFVKSDRLFHLILFLALYRI